MNRKLTASAVVIALVAASLVLAQAKKRYDKPPEMKIDVNKTYIATIDTNKGKMVIELLPKEAPKTVNSFVFLAREKFFDGLIFHRVMPGFMIQGGDPKGDGTGGPGYEFENENRNTSRRFIPGTLAMANAGPGTNGSQFFIMDADYPLQPNLYTIFGQLKEGQDVVHAIATTPTGAQAKDRPNTDVVIKSVTIEEK